ncbi:hypothetical protein TSOC_007132 [Tetrabaena socialis]|uniref:Pherophorin domain-containing protein n=1 Tax=Tetrabaena socialis TaxID=47790 RepID=A0A2J8A1X7_9CHLO|nr:hypothetical protein TSOC_007132 [Tetrabaena socialis]|eukprot:PNH06498.1 hypothetical protein TSOC_007132 [Tetrabaena socialis]
MSVQAAPQQHRMTMWPCSFRCPAAPGGYCQYAKWNATDTTDKEVYFTIKDSSGTCLPSGVASKNYTVQGLDSSCEPRRTVTASGYLQTAGCDVVNVANECLWKFSAASQPIIIQPAATQPVATLTGSRDSAPVTSTQACAAVPQPVITYPVATVAAPPSTARIRLAAQPAASQPITAQPSTRSCAPEPVA